MLVEGIAKPFAGDTNRDCQTCRDRDRGVEASSTMPHDLCRAPEPIPPCDPLIRTLLDHSVPKPLRRLSIVLGHPLDRESPRMQVDASSKVNFGTRSAAQMDTSKTPAGCCRPLPSLVTRYCIANHVGRPAPSMLPADDGAATPRCRAVWTDEQLYPSKFH